MADYDAWVFISHTQDDAHWARRLAEGLELRGVETVLQERDIEPGQVRLRRIEEAIGTARAAILVLSASALGDPKLYDEYAALLHQSAERGLRLIPALHGSLRIRMPPLAGTRLWADFRGLGPTEYDDKVAALAAVIPDPPPVEPRAVSGRAIPVEVLEAARSTRTEPPDAPSPPAFVVTYARPDAEYGNRLVEWVTNAGLPAWSIADLAWGSRWVYEIRQRLRHALAVVVVMSPAAEESEDVEREVLEGQWYGREFFPVLLRGDRNFLLASSSYFDARGGILPGKAELRRLQRIQQARLSGQPTAPPIPAPAPARTTAARKPAGIPLRRLHAFLQEGELAHADLLTTSLLLAAAHRLEAGWMEPADACELPTSLLAGIDAAWSEQTGGQQGFQQQVDLYPHGADDSDFSNFVEAYGWKAGRDIVFRYGERRATPKYHEFVDQAPYPPGFFPTLRNQQIEAYSGWYVRWQSTVVAVHLQLHRWLEKEGRR